MNLVHAGSIGRVVLLEIPSGSDRLAEGGRRGLQTRTDFNQLACRSVNAFLLNVRALLLAVSAVANRLKLSGHLLDMPGEIGQLTCDQRRVVFRCHRRFAEILWSRARSVDSSRGRV